MLAYYAISNYKPKISIKVIKHSSAIYLQKNRNGVFQWWKKIIYIFCNVYSVNKLPLLSSY